VAAADLLSPFPERGLVSEIVGPAGEAPRRAPWRRDLRHTGNHLTAEAGATLRELMERMGHSTTRAAHQQRRTAPATETAKGNCSPNDLQTAA
jgi:hypothetical protein